MVKNIIDIINMSKMNVLITGGCGFIGSNFINFFVNKYPDYNVYNVDALYYCSSLYNIKVSDSENYKFIKGNVQSKDLMSYILNEYKITHIIHFAAQSHVDTSFSNPNQYVLDNILGTHNLLECIKDYNILTNNIKLMIHVSTDEVYGESGLTEKSKDEMSILCPTNPYAATKASAELLVNSYIQSYKLPIIITRGNNVYGPHQHIEKLVPKFIQLLLNKKKCTIHGNGSSLRSFIYIDDVVTAFDMIFHKGKINQIYNIGTEHEYSVLDITTRIVTIVNDGLVDDNINFVKDRHFNDKRYFVNYEKLKDLGWEPTIGIDTGLVKSYEWIRSVDTLNYWN